MNIKPMLAKVYDETNNKTMPFPCYCQPKVDGVRMIWDGERYYSRTGKPLSVPTSLEEILHSEFKDYPLDGELYIPNAPFTLVSGQVRRKCRPTEDVRYMVFDTPLHETNFSGRISLLKTQFTELFYADKIDSNSPISLLSTDTILEEFEVPDRLQRYLGQGYEGLILRDPRGLYEQKRSKTLQKHKPWHFKEALVCGWTAGKGKHQDVIGAFVLEGICGEALGNVGSGFTDEEREHYTDLARQGSLIGRIFQIKYKEKTKTGKFREPIFIHEVQL
ncbi:MAG: ATP-dependent DNA ligase [Candidatus Thorarchaeota archaeon]